MWYGVGILICLIVAITIDIIAETKDKNWSSWIFSSGMLAGIFMFLGLYSSKPTAMDVYQGKTTLEVTYKDGVPVDSIVVFKNKKK